MSYFTQEFLTFMQELPANNNTEWFNANKPRYQKFVKEPFEQFVDALIAALGQTDNTLANITHKECIFRINRDVRFSADKSPYKINKSALISSFGRKNMTLPALYLEVSAEHLRLYSGCYQLETKEVQKVREKIYNESARFNELVTNADFVEAFGQVRGEKAKRLNKPFSEMAENQPLLFNKSFYYFMELPPESIFEPNIIDLLVAKYNLAEPLNAFLSEALSHG